MLKKKIIATVLSLGILGQMAPAFADDVLGDKEIGIYINGKALYDYTDRADKRPIMKNSRVLAPLRIISESFNAEVKWDNHTKTVSINDRETNQNYTFVVGQNYFTKNGNKIALDQSAIITKNGRTVVPIRAIGEMYGKVEWDAKNYNVLITTERKTDQIINKDLPKYKQPHPKHVQDNLDKGVFIGNGKEALNKYISDFSKCSVGIGNTNEKVYYIDNSDFLNLRIDDFRNFFMVYSDINGGLVTGWYIDDTGILKDGSNSLVQLTYNFKTPEEANQKLKYIVITGKRDGENCFYVIRVSSPIPMK